jgi:hypothetical protein
VIREADERGVGSHRREQCGGPSAVADGSISRGEPHFRSIVSSAGTPVDMADPAYLSRVRIHRQGGPQRLAFLPALDDPVQFGVHDEVAAHYHVDPGTVAPRPTTLDYVVAAAAG